MQRRPPSSTRTVTLFPYPTPFRSEDVAGLATRVRELRAEGVQPLLVAVGELLYDPEDIAREADLPLFAVLPHDPQSAATLAGRSEEHTSELQSLMRISYAVFCLKKKLRQITTKYEVLKSATY